jgi:AbrB family looped-hinge helix DNA binding protein
MTMKEFESRVGQKGQITIPAEMRNHFGIKPKDTVEFVEEEDGIKVKPRKSVLLEGFGAVNPHKRPEDWAQVRAEMEAEIAEDAMTRGQQ